MWHTAELKHDHSQWSKLCSIIDRNRIVHVSSWVTQTGIVWCDPNWSFQAVDTIYQDWWSWCFGSSVYMTRCGSTGGTICRLPSPLEIGIREWSGGIGSIREDRCKRDSPCDDKLCHLVYQKWKVLDTGLKVGLKAPVWENYCHLVVG